MKKIVIFLILLILIGNVPALARVLYWHHPAAPGGSDPSQWNDPDNWWQTYPESGPIDSPPGPDDHMIIHTGTPMPVINSNEWIVGTVTPAWHSGITAEMKMTHGGFMYVSGLMRLGNDYEETGSSLGILHIDGGMIIAVNMQVGYNSSNQHGSGQVYLTDGTLYCESLAFAEDSGSGPGTGNIDITYGILTIGGDVTSQVAAWIAAGRITAYGGQASVEYSYNTDTERTDVMAVPGNFYWNGSLDTDWYNEDNWDAKGVPCPGHDVVINDEGGYLPVLDSFIPGVQTITLASQPSAGSSLTMQTGSSISVGTTRLASAANTAALLTMDGGHLNTTNLVLGYPGSAQVNLNSGIIHTWNLYINNGNIDITDGKFILHSDKTNSVAAWHGSGRITAYSGSGRIVYDYDKTRPNKTTVTAARNMQIAWGPVPGSENKILADTDTILSWSAGSGADHHDVYLGTDLNDVNSADISDLTGIYRGRQDTNSYGPCSLEFDSIYYWRIDEVDGGTIHKGDVWKLTTKVRSVYPQGRKYEIWAGPDCGHNNNELFVENAPWKTAQHATDTFKLHSRALDNNDLERGWILDVPQMVDTLEAAHMKLDVEASAVQGYLGGNSGLGTGVMERSLIDPVYEAGGKVDRITLDAVFSRLLEGGNKDSCWFGRSIEVTMANIVTYFRYMHEKYPDIKICALTNFPWWDFEGYPAYFGSYSWTTGSGYEYNELLDALLAALEAAGESLDSVHADNPYNYYCYTESPYTPDPIDDSARLSALEAYCRRNNLKFGMIYNTWAPEEEHSDQRFYEETMEMLNARYLAGAQPDFMVVQSWTFRPDQYLPDTELYSFTRLVRDFTLQTESLYPRYENDINYDGMSDFGDLEIMMENWLETNLIIKGDINNDQTVDFSDLVQLAQDWLD